MVQLLEYHFYVFRFLMVFAFNDINGLTFQDHLLLLLLSLNYNKQKPFMLVITITTVILGNFFFFQSSQTKPTVRAN